MVVLSCWVMEGTKRSYSMVVLACWVKEGTKMAIVLSSGLVG